MTDDTNSVESGIEENHPYRLPGTPPLPFDKGTDNNTENRGDVVWAVIDIGRSGEDPVTDRVFYDEPAARHHAKRIGSETIVHPTRLE